MTLQNTPESQRPIQFGYLWKDKVREIDFILGGLAKRFRKLRESERNSEAIAWLSLAEKDIAEARFVLGDLGYFRERNQQSEIAELAGAVRELLDVLGSGDLDGQLATILRENNRE